MKIVNDVKKILINKKLVSLTSLLWLLFYLGLVIGCTFNLSPRVFDSDFSMSCFRLKGFQEIEFFIFSELVVLLSMFFLSLTAFGVIQGVFMVFLKGFGIGLILSQLYIQYLFRGIIFGITFFLPGTFVSTMSMVKLSEKSIKFGLSLWRKILDNPTEGSLIKMFEFHIRSTAKLLIISIFGVLITSGLCSLYFKFLSS